MDECDPCNFIPRVPCINFAFEEICINLVNSNEWNWLFFGRCLHLEGGFVFEFQVGLEFCDCFLGFGGG